MTMHIHTPVFIRFSYEFFRIVWHFKAIFLTLIALTAGGAVVIAFYEGLPLGDALYFAGVTGLTIGYGDIVVKSTVGRIVAILIGFIGVLFSGLVVAAALHAVGLSIKKVPK